MNHEIRTPLAAILGFAENLFDAEVFAEVELSIRQLLPALSQFVSAIASKRSGAVKSHGSP
jgi:signal transduction histidine kinase